jgi:tRNA-splicing ligase RtcB (3'-phosphate/5'-hydroxy nucleic acid ligase)
LVFMKNLEIKTMIYNHQKILNTLVWGEPIENAVDQMWEFSKEPGVVHTALMADHHHGFLVPIGGVVALRDAVCPAAVGYDIGCGNDAVSLNTDPKMVQENIHEIMDTIFNTLSFGVGVKNNERAYPDLSELWDHPAWDIPEVGQLKDLARQQLGTIGAGNHYVDLFVGDDYKIWVGVHFGSRGLGHKIATIYIKEAEKYYWRGSKNLLPLEHPTGQGYLLAMDLAGKYARYGRKWVVEKIASLLNAKIEDIVSNHHNYAWKESHFDQDLYVIRKGATPLFPSQRGFIGGSMGDNAYIVRGIETESSQMALYSAPHGAGRIMSRTEAKGKFKKGKQVRQGAITQDMMNAWLREKGVTLRGGDLDEAPQAYKRLVNVLEYHQETLQVTRVLRPIGVAMAGKRDGYDPYKD